MNMYYTTVVVWNGSYIELQINEWFDHRSYEAILSNCSVSPQKNPGSTGWINDLWVTSAIMFYQLNFSFYKGWILSSWRSESSFWGKSLKLSELITS